MRRMPFELGVPRDGAFLQFLPPADGGGAVAFDRQGGRLAVVNRLFTPPAAAVDLPEYPGGSRTDSAREVVPD